MVRLTSLVSIKYIQDRINIFEMLAISGDLSVYAKRDDVVLCRKTETGSQIHHIDLLDEETIRIRILLSNA